MGDQKQKQEQHAKQGEQAKQDQGRQKQDHDGGDGGRESLLAQSDLEHFRTRWESIQTRFVDEPRGSVENADSLVAELMQSVARGFAEERSRLESRWEKDEDPSTEDLRVTLTRYRSFFDRLLET